MVKTNVLRVLDKLKINYKTHEYDENMTVCDEIAVILNEDPNCVFKTLVTVGKSKEHYVFMIPGSKELDLKKCAQVSGEKNIEMIHQKELLPLTGYIHGGCSPIGMKKAFKTFVDDSILDKKTITFSGGKKGLQVEMSVENFKKNFNYEFCSLTR